MGMKKGSSLMETRRRNRIFIKDTIYIDCIAKYFETLEPGASFRLLRKYLYETCGETASERIIATGTRGSALDALCNAHGYRFLESWGGSLC